MPVLYRKKKRFLRTILATKIFISIRFLNEVLLEALDDFKNFQTSISFTRNLNFSFISIGSDFGKSETDVGQILQSAGPDKELLIAFKL